MAKVFPSMSTSDKLFHVTNKATGYSAGGFKTKAAANAYAKKLSAEANSPKGRYARKFTDLQRKSNVTGRGRIGQQGKVEGETAFGGGKYKKFSNANRGATEYEVREGIGKASTGKRGQYQELGTNKKGATVSKSFRVRNPSSGKVGAALDH